jgi:hypothetical protein
VSTFFRNADSFKIIFLGVGSFLAVLSTLHPDQGNQLQRHVHLPSAQGAAKGRAGHRMRHLRLPWMRFERLKKNRNRLIPPFLSFPSLSFPFVLGRTGVLFEKKRNLHE